MGDMTRIYVISILLITAALPITVNARQTWGTYRPGIYAGVKARVPDSPLFGIMFSNADMMDGYNHIRHDCDDRDQMQGFGYEFHDGVQAAVQHLPDLFTGVNLTTSFVQVPGSGWVLRISGKKLPSSTISSMNLFWYITLQSRRHSIIPFDGYIGDHHTHFSGDFGEIGKYNISTSSIGNSHPVIPNFDRPGEIHLNQPYFSSAVLPSESFWDVKEHVRQSMQSSITSLVQQRLKFLRRKYKSENAIRERMGSKTFSVPSDDDMLSQIDDADLFATLSNDVNSNATVVYAQHIFSLPFEIDIACVPSSDGQPESPLLSQSFVSDLIEEKRNEFKIKMEQCFNLTAKGFSESDRRVAQSALSDLIGSIGYFHGRSIQSDPITGNSLLAEEASLIAVAPSRSFFPRGFLWDEGFQQLLLSRYDFDQSLEILESWIDLIQNSGWLPREQILGEEARARVPHKFQTQDPRVANPPTLLIAIQQLIRLSSGRDMQMSSVDSPDNLKQVRPVPNSALASFLERIYPKLLLLTSWFLRTQKGHQLKSFRWQGCTPGHCLASGFDDIPRPNVVLHQAHVDLHSWVIYLLDTMTMIAEIVGDDSNSQKLEQMSSELKKAMDHIHWDPIRKIYADVYQPNSTDSDVYTFSDHIGYHTLIPFCLGQIPSTSPKLQSILQILADPEIFWTNYGITSLSMKDDLFGKDENYWRGPIWININYMIVSSLHSYGYDQDGPYASTARDLYTRLRSNLIANIIRVHSETGYFWEQYNHNTGNGQRTHPFTGWTTLVLLMMAEKY
uniref:Mannosyl-oligosaccharide glucosidase n=1 Tax=Spongospora subterranea TaxID=70186 RepID=A0A0H5R612_9EUKA|eukprot:CRZ09595.1 hypothetical protein [Spongospora subterranea]